MRATLIANTETAQSASSRSRRGYTLMELMIVVAITGILAAVAIPSFQSYVFKSRTTEATNFLGVIKLRQESYRAEFGGYAGLAPAMDAVAWNPAAEDVMVDSNLFPWNPNMADFVALGASPDSTSVRFGYAMCAGTPAQAAAGGGGTDLTGIYAVPAAQLDFYFIAQARADLDGDGTAVTFELTSFSRNVWVSDNHKGWE